MSKLIEVISLTKLYRSAQESVRALDKVSLGLDSGDYLSIVGPSGAGKSTLLHIMGGLEYPSEGKVLFKGKNLYQMRDKELSCWRNETIGFVFQFYHLIEELNVIENVALAAFRSRRKFSFKKAYELLKYLGLEGKAKFSPSQLSGGEKQKIAFARALINDPEIILCDEPTGNLDKDSQEKIVQILDRLNKEKSKTIVLVTHNLELAKRAKRILSIRDGQVEEEKI